MSRIQSMKFEVNIQRDSKRWTQFRTFFFFFQFCVSVHHIIINKNTSLMQLISIYFTYSKSLHVSGRILPIIRSI